MDPGVAKKTQDTLGKIIKKPPLTDKLLSKPPFRFLHDVMTSVIKTTGFMKGLYADNEMNSENVKDKDAKIAFLQKAIDMVVAVTGHGVAAKPAKIVAGHEPERTNEFLQALAAAINANVDNDAYVKKVLSGGGGEPKKERGDKEEKREKDKDRTRSASRRKDDEKHREKDKEKSHDRDKDREKRHRDRGGEGHEEKEKDKEKDKERHRDRREKSRDREDRHRDRDKDRERRKKTADKSASQVEVESSSRPTDTEAVDRKAAASPKRSLVENSQGTKPKSIRKVESDKRVSSWENTSPTKTARKSSVSGAAKKLIGKKSSAPSQEMAEKPVPKAQSPHSSRLKQTKPSITRNPEKGKTAPKSVSKLPKSSEKAASQKGTGTSSHSQRPFKPVEREEVLPQRSPSKPGHHTLPSQSFPAGCEKPESHQRKRRDSRPSQHSPPLAKQSSSPNLQSPKRKLKAIPENAVVGTSQIGKATPAHTSTARKKQVVKMGAGHSTGVKTDKYPPSWMKKRASVSSTIPGKENANHGTSVSIQDTHEETELDAEAGVSRSSVLACGELGGAEGEGLFNTGPACFKDNLVLPNAALLCNSAIVRYDDDDDDDDDDDSMYVPNYCLQAASASNLSPFSGRSDLSESDKQQYSSPQFGIHDDRFRRREKQVIDFSKKSEKTRGGGVSPPLISNIINSSRPGKTAQRTTAVGAEGGRGRTSGLESTVGWGPTPDRGMTTGSSSGNDVTVKASVSRYNLPMESRGPQTTVPCDYSGAAHIQKETEEKENESPEKNGEKEPAQETPSRLQRPTSAKGARRRRQGREPRDDDEDGLSDDEEFQQRENHEPSIGENDLPPQVAAARKMARPPSARPAPPRPKQDGVEAEPAMRLGTGAPTNLIVDDGKQSDDEDENFLVEESAPPPPPPEPVSSQAEQEDDAEHGALVKKMLESKKETEQQQQPTKKTEIERPALSDAQRRKQRELVSKEIERLQTSIQSLTRSANPLGKIMDYVQEDMDSMQKELDRWRTENKEHALALRRENNVTDRAIEPLKAQLADIDRAITDQLDLIAASKSNIIRGDRRIEKMLQSIARS